jgi:hypothetical protein
LVIDFEEGKHWCFLKELRVKIFNSLFPDRLIESILPVDRHITRWRRLHRRIFIFRARLKRRSVWKILDFVQIMNETVCCDEKWRWSEVPNLSTLALYFPIFPLYSSFVNSSCAAGGRLPVPEGAWEGQLWKGKQFVSLVFNDIISLIIGNSWDCLSSTENSTSSLRAGQQRSLVRSFSIPSCVPW